jgi:protein-S-isoprenylcysteine O-methyltransferase Ste14
MTFYDWFAGLVLWANLPVPIFWLVLHSRVEFWRMRVRAAYLTAVAAAWGTVTLLGWIYGRGLLEAAEVPVIRKVAGAALALLDGWILINVERQLGVHRLAGRAELTSGGQIKTDGYYTYVRHPRYAAMLLSTLGACLMAAGPLLWMLAGAWSGVVLLMIHAEESELLARFGPAYAEYRRNVPALLPRLPGRKS